MSTPKQSSEPQTFTISYSPGDTSVDITLESCEEEEGGRKVIMMMMMVDDDGDGVADGNGDEDDIDDNDYDDVGSTPGGDDSHL